MRTQFQKQLEVADPVQDQLPVNFESDGVTLENGDGTFSVEKFYAGKRYVLNSFTSTELGFYKLLITIFLISFQKPRLRRGIEIS